VVRLKIQIELRIPAAGISFGETQPIKPMYFGAELLSRTLIYPYAGHLRSLSPAGNGMPTSCSRPESTWFRMGEFAWGICSGRKASTTLLAPAGDGRHGTAGFKVVLARRPPLRRSGWPRNTLKTPLWTNRASSTPRHAQSCCLNNDFYWDYCRRIVRAMASDLSEHPQLIAWQIDNGIGGHNTESASMRSRAVIGSRGPGKIETVDRLNELGDALLGQVTVIGMRFRCRW